MKNFKKLELQKNLMSKLAGGFAPVPTSSKTINDSGCEEIMTDSYEDCNGNGEWDPNETGTKTTTIVCK